MSICLKGDWGKGLIAIEILPSKSANTSQLDIKSVQQLQSFVAVWFNNGQNNS
jgi:hypothetical protein